MAVMVTAVDMGMEVTDMDVDTMERGSKCLHTHRNNTTRVLGSPCLSHLGTSRWIFGLCTVLR